MNQQTVTPAAVNAAAKRMAAKAKQMLGTCPLQKKLNTIVRKSKEKPNSSILVIFYSPPTYMLPHEKEKDGQFFDTVSGEIFEKLTAADAPTCLPFEVFPLDIVARDEYENVGLEIFGHDRFTTPTEEGSLLWPIAKMALEFFRQEKCFQLDFEYGFKKVGYWDHGYDGSEWNEEYEFMGMITRKTYQTKDLDKFIKGFGKLPKGVVRIGDQHVKLNT